MQLSVCMQRRVLSFHALSALGYETMSGEACFDGSAENKGLSTVALYVVIMYNFSVNYFKCYLTYSFFVIKYKLPHLKILDRAHQNQID